MTKQLEPEQDLAPTSRGPLISVLIPVYNEQATLDSILTLVTNLDLDLEVIAVDDGSTDGSPEVLKSWQSHPRVTTLYHDTNKGKGRAIRTALEAVSGQFVIVQDADLEYDPAQYPNLIDPLIHETADVVYGSRYLADHNLFSSGRLAFRFGIEVLNLAVFLLYGYRLSDEATCYKVFPTDRLRQMDLCCERFEFCPEVTAKAARMKLQIVEVPVRYQARTVQAGKKIRWKDGLEALRCLWRWRHWVPREGSSTPPTKSG